MDYSANGFVLIDYGQYFKQCYCMAVSWMHMYTMEFVWLYHRVLYSGKVWQGECSANLLFSSVWWKKFGE